LKEWLADDLLQRIATENGLSETAFLTREPDFFRLRWFTPMMEVDLCGHATLAPAFVLFETGYLGPILTFETRSGTLTATKRNGLVELNFPSRPGSPCPAPSLLIQALGAKPREVLKSRDYLAVFDSEAEVASLSPDIELLTQLDCLGIIVTARGENADFVSRFFAPRAGVPEDPVTGSAHCCLTPFWSARLGKTEMRARQVSKRGGELRVRLDGGRVKIAGQAVTTLRGELSSS
jgi:predicted PhzF superfamily epimerase YddE/YHI9